jgi:hypothetical protein
MRLTTIAAFGVGYVLGSKAGRERFDQLAAWAERGLPALGGSDLDDRLERYASSLEGYANRAREGPLSSVAGITAPREAR